MSAPLSSSSVDQRPVLRNAETDVKSGGCRPWHVVVNLREELKAVSGIWVSLIAAQDARISTRLTPSEYEFTLWSADLDLLRWTAPLVVERLRKVPGLVDSIGMIRRAAGYRPT